MTSPRRQTSQTNRRQRPHEADIIAMPMPPQPPPLERQPEVQMERIGEILRRARERRADNLQHIAAYLCIRRGYLEALEESRYEEFPAETYIIGFLRSYAEYLGFDGKDAIGLYRSEMAGRRKKQVLSMPTPIPEGRSPSVFVIIGAIVAVILVYATWYGFSATDRVIFSTPPAPPSAPVATETPGNATPATTIPSAPPVAPALPPAAQQPAQNLPPVTTAPTAPASSSSPQKPVAQEPAPTATPPAVKPPHLVIRADQSSWVMISDNKGGTVFDRVLKPGETYQLPDKPGLLLTTGNGGGIVVTLDGADLPKLSNSSSGILRDIPLDSGHLKASFPLRD